MTATFYGKWRLFFHRGQQYAAAGYLDALHDTWCLRYDNPPGKETVVIFVLRDDNKLCILLSNGKYVGPGPYQYELVAPLDHATGFAFAGFEYSTLPPSFDSKLHSLHDNTYPLDQDHLLMAVNDPTHARVFTISQITPRLATVQAKGNGDGLDFSGADLTDGTLTQVSLIGADFSHCNLTTAKLKNCTLTKAQLNNSTVKATEFSGSNLSGANLNHVDLTGVFVVDPLPHFYTSPLSPPSPTDPRPTFFESKLNQSLLGNEWSRLDLTGATILNLSSPLSSKDKPLKANYSILTNLNQNNFSGHLLPYAVFDNAVLDNVNLDGCDLSNASFIQASMHNTVLSNAILKNADMTGAQLGGLSSLFTLPAGYETHLNAGPTVDQSLRDQFAQHGITLSSTATVSMQAPDRVWQLNDLGHNIIYTVRLDHGGDATQVLRVYKTATAAELVGAYMPDAIMTGANLYGVIASGAQLYGSKARLDGSAILEKVEFNDANLSNLNLTQAKLYGANLSGAYLFNAKFNKANLSPSADNVATNLSKSNLQGADFTDAQLYGANLTNAAVAINVPTKTDSKQGGVYLFSLPYTGDTATLEQYTTELTNAASSYFSLTPGGTDADVQKYLTALKNKDLNTLKIAFFKHQITLSANAKISDVEKDSVWQIIDTNQSYSVWIDPNSKGKTEIYASKSLLKLQAGFLKRKITLRWQTSAVTDTAGQQWIIDNDSENPQNFSTGYVRFILKLNGNALDVYGAALRIVRLGDQGKEEFDTEPCLVTILNQNNMNADTILPDGASLAVNQSRSGKSWDTLWLRAAQPPQPPDCVPTDSTWCHPSTRRKE